MKIESIQATPVSVPGTRTGTMSIRKATHASRTIVEITTDTGLIGLGETRGVWAAAIINERFAPALIGLPVEERQRARALCLQIYLDYGHPEHLLDQSAFSGIELALWDLLGKQADLPLFRLLGGPVRERAPFGAYAYTVDPDEGHTEAEVPDIMAEIASRSIAETGASLFEFKVGRHSVDCDISTVCALRDALGPDVALAADANMGFSLDGARRLLGGVAKVGLANIEEPVADLAQLRAEFDVPVSTHCINLDALKPYPQIDAVVPDIDLPGGIQGTIDLMKAVSAQGRACWLRSM